MQNKRTRSEYYVEAVRNYYRAVQYHARSARQTYPTYAYASYTPTPSLAHPPTTPAAHYLPSPAYLPLPWRTRKMGGARVSTWCSACLAAAARQA